MPQGMAGRVFIHHIDSDDDVQNLGAVQVHDPFIKRVLVVAIHDMFKYVKDNNIPIGFKDLGAGVFLAQHLNLLLAGGMGCELNLNNVPVVDPKLDPEIIACSETKNAFALWYLLIMRKPSAIFLIKNTTWVSYTRCRCSDYWQCYSRITIQNSLQWGTHL